MRRTLYFLCLSAPAYSIPSESDFEKAREIPYYFHSVNLTGIVRHVIFPGPPCFYSIEEGDYAEPRVILEVDSDSLRSLIEIQALIKPEHYMGWCFENDVDQDTPLANWVTIDSHFQDPPPLILRYLNQKITIQAVMSAHPTRRHTPFIIEIVKVVDHV